MSNTSTKNIQQAKSQQRAPSTYINPAEMRVSPKQSKHQLQEDDSLVVSDSAPQNEMSMTATAAVPSIIDPPFVLAQAASDVAETASASSASASASGSAIGALSSTMVMGLAALGGVAIATKNNNNDLSTPSSSGTTTASGSIVAGPVINGNDLVIHLYAADGTTEVGTATIDATGHYTANIVGGYTGVVIAKVSSSGTGVADYFDEATGQQVDLTAVLTAVGVATSSGLTLSVNPLTTIAAQLAGLNADGSGAIASEAVVNSANNTVAAAFGIQGSLIAPTALTAVVDANGNANTNADVYGKVLAALSGLDQINSGNLQTTIQALAEDLGQNNGQLSATSKFNLVVAAQDSDLVGLTPSLASDLTTIAQITVNDIQDVISSGRSSFSDNELASALSAVLHTNESITTDHLDAVIQSITAASSATDIASLTQAAGRYISLSSGSVLNIAEAESGVTLHLQGLDITAGDTITVFIQDPNAIFDNGVVELANLVVGNDGHSVVLPNLTQWLWTFDTATETNGIPLSLTVTHNGTTVTGKFDVDMLAPSEMTRNSLTAESTGLWSGYTNHDATITAPTDWNPADHWQYRIGETGEWVNGPEFNSDGVAQLSLTDGIYGATTANKIYLRTYDDAGNESATVTSRAQFVVDTTAPTLAVLENGHVTISEEGAVVLLADTVLSSNPTASLLDVIVQNANDPSHLASVGASSTSDIGQELSFSSTAQLAYGTYHYYAVDYAGNVTAIQNGPTKIIDSQAPVVNADAGIADQTVYLNQELNLVIDTGTIFTDPDGNALTYTATLADGSALPTWLTLNTDDPSNVTLTATANDVATNVAAGPLTIRLTATDSAPGATVKSVYDDFTLTYVDHILNSVPVVDWPIGSWNVNVGTNSNNETQQYVLDGNLASDADNNPLTYAVTSADHLTPAPDWVSIYIDSNGTRYLQCIPPAGTVGLYNLAVSVTDGLSDPVFDNFDLTVGDDGSVFYQGQALTSFDLTLSNDLLSGTSTLLDGSSIDLGVSGYQHFYGDTSLTDTANVILDNAAGSTGADAPVLHLGNFSTINIDVISATELNYIGTWKLLGADSYTAQTVNIHVDNILNVVDTIDTADFADTTINITGAANVTINNLDGNYALHALNTSTNLYEYVSSPILTLDASGLTGNLTVAFDAASAIVTGGQGDDALTFKSAYGWNEDPAAQITMTGGLGMDTFKIGMEATNTHLIVTDYDVTQDALLDLSEVTDGYSAMLTATEAPTLNQPGLFSQNASQAIDVLGVQNNSDFDIYIDVDHDNTYTSNDVMLTLQNFTLGSTSMDALINHAPTIV